MTIRTKDGRRIALARMGNVEQEDGSDEFAGYDIDSPNRDLFGRPILVTLHIGDMDRFLSMYAFAPVDFEALGS